MGNCPHTPPLISLRAKCWLRGGVGGHCIGTCITFKSASNQRPIRFPKDNYISSFQPFHCNIAIIKIIINSNINIINNININIKINNNNNSL